MATGSTPIYNLPYPEPNDPVNVAGDIQQLAGRIEQVLPGLSAPNVKVTAKNIGTSPINVGDPVRVINGSITTITEGSTVTSITVEIEKSDASVDSTMPAQGICVSSVIAPNEFGEVILSGIADAFLNTSAYTVGQILYVAAGGGLTGEKPVYPIKAQQIAAVIVSDINSGMIMMLSGGGASAGPTTWGALKSGL